MACQAVHEGTNVVRARDTDTIRSRLDRQFSSGLKALLPVACIHFVYGNGLPHGRLMPWYSHRFSRASRKVVMLVRQKFNSVSCRILCARRARNSQSALRRAVGETRAAKLFKVESTLAGPEN